MLGLFLPGRARLPRTGLAAACLVALTACGSQLAPGEVVGAGTGVAGQGAPLLAPDGQSVPTGTLTGEGAAGATGGIADGAGGAQPGASAGGSVSAPPAGPPIRVESCEGFRNGPGITDDSITIGNSSDISGPVPGIFEPSQDAVEAFVTYFNRVNPDGICGRSLALKTYDSRTDASADQRNHLDACESVFAMVGSMSAFDSGGAAATEDCGLPDVRASAVTRERQACDTCFGAQSNRAGEVNNVVADHVLANHREASQNAASLYINAGAAAKNGQLQPRAMTERGMRFTYVQGIEVSEFNYSPFVQQLKERDIGYVQMTGAVPQFVRLAQTMAQQGYEPDVFVLDATAYDQDFLAQGGPDVEGVTVYTNVVPFEEAERSPETRLYLDWLEATKPGAEPGFLSAFSWSAARLFVETAARLGGRLDRQSFLQAIRGTAKWTGNGLHSPQNVGAKRTGECFRLLQVDRGRFTPLGAARFACNGTTTVD